MPPRKRRDTPRALPSVREEEEEGKEQVQMTAIRTQPIVRDPHVGKLLWSALPQYRRGGLDPDRVDTDDPGLLGGKRLTTFVVRSTTAIRVCLWTGSELYVEKEERPRQMRVTNPRDATASLYPSFFIQGLVYTDSSGMGGERVLLVDAPCVALPFAERRKWLVQQLYTLQHTPGYKPWTLSWNSALPTEETYPRSPEDKARLLGGDSPSHDRMYVYDNNAMYQWNTHTPLAWVFRGGGEKKKKNKKDKGPPRPNPKVQLLAVEARLEREWQKGLSSSTALSRSQFVVHDATTTGEDEAVVIRVGVVQNAPLRVTRAALVAWINLCCQHGSEWGSSLRIRQLPPAGTRVKFYLVLHFTGTLQEQQKQWRDHASVGGPLRDATFNFGDLAWMTTWGQDMQSSQWFGVDNDSASNTYYESQPAVLAHIKSITSTIPSWKQEWLIEQAYAEGAALPLPYTTDPDGEQFRPIAFALESKSDGVYDAGPLLLDIETRHQVLKDKLLPDFFRLSLWGHPTMPPFLTVDPMITEAILTPFLVYRHRPPPPPPPPPPAHADAVEEGEETEDEREEEDTNISYPAINPEADSDAETITYPVVEEEDRTPTPPPSPLPREYDDEIVALLMSVALL